MKIVLSLRDALPGYALELVFVDDGSRDRSLDILLDYVRRYPGIVQVVKLSRNFGQTPAIQAGLRYATGDCVGIISADLQEPWESFPRMVMEWERSAKFVIGERQAREESVSHQFFFGNLLESRAAAGIPRLSKDGVRFLPDRPADCGRCQSHQREELFHFRLDLLAWIPAGPHADRPALARGGNIAMALRKEDQLTVDTLIGFTNLPARLISVMSFTLAILCLLFLGFSSIIWLRLRSAPPGWMTQVALLTLLGSMILFALGIVSEYLLRILDEARKRPPYVVDRIINKLDPPG